MVKQSLVRLRLLLLILLFTFSMTTTKLTAKDDRSTDTHPVEQQNDLTSNADQQAINEEQRKESIASILLMLLGGVGIMGVALIGMTMMWGAHARRVARTTDHPPTQQDELWYLRRPPPEEVDTEVHSTDGDETPAPDRETDS